MAKAGVKSVSGDNQLLVELMRVQIGAATVARPLAKTYLALDDVR